MLSPGTPAPSFSLPDHSGKIVSLADHAGQWVVLYFYPRDDTPGCTTEACEFRDSWQALIDSNAVVLGVSNDSPEMHQRFRDKYQLPFTLLSDADNEVATAYDAWGQKSMFGKKYLGTMRTTYVIDGDGIIRHVFEKVKPKGHAAQVLAELGR